jgi:glutathione peroxidase
LDSEFSTLPDKKIGYITSFFELAAEDIDENPIIFDQFKGQVTVIANVASYCGYTESHYEGLNKLFAKFQGSKVPLNILAFPCNQFGEQE